MTSGPLIRDTYAELPFAVEKENVDCELSKPLFALITARKGWREAIRDFLANELGWEVTSLGSQFSVGPDKGSNIVRGRNLGAITQQI